MPIASLQSQTSRVMPTDVPVENIAASKTLSEEQKVGEMTRQFEALLVRQILTQAQKPAFKSDLLPNSGVSSDIYQDMMINNLADKISSAGSLGFAKELQKQFAHPNQKPEPADSKAGAKTISSTDSQNHNAPPVHMTKAPRL